MLRAIIKTMRPRQWTKNVFVFAALVFDRQLTHWEAFLQCLAGFIIFCFLSSAVYIINDIKDVEADRQHPKKKFRPIAAGKLPIPVAMAVAVIILLITLPVSYLLSPNFAIITISYFFINLAYSLWLKHIPLIDVLILSSGFVLRVAGGVTLIQVERFSPWLYICITLLALYIGLGKRRAELILLTDSAERHRKVLDGYSVPFLDQLITVVSTATIVCYSFYTFSAPNLPSNHFMMLTIPFVLYAIFRYLFLIQIKKEGGEPEELLLKDRPLQITVLLWGLAVIAVFYVFGSV